MNTREVGLHSFSRVVPIRNFMLFMLLYHETYLRAYNT
jgi:hypothetical protein